MREAMIKKIKNFATIKPVLCRLHLHSWGRWGSTTQRLIRSGTILESEYYYQTKRCKNCGIAKERRVCLIP